MPSETCVARVLSYTHGRDKPRKQEHEQSQKREEEK